MLVLSLFPISFSYPARRIILPCFSGDVMSGVQVATELHYFVCVCSNCELLVYTHTHWFCVLKTYNREYRTQGEREIDSIKCESTTFFFLQHSLCGELLRSQWI